MSGPRIASLKSTGSDDTVVCAPMTETADSLISMPIEELEKCFEAAIANATLDNFPTIEMYIIESFRRGKGWKDFLCDIFGHKLERISEGHRPKIPEPFATQIPFDDLDDIVADKLKTEESLTDEEELKRKVIALFESHPLSTLSTKKINRLKEMINISITSGASSSAAATLESEESEPTTKTHTTEEPVSAGAGSALPAAVNKTPKRSRKEMEAVTSKGSRVLIKTDSGIHPTRTASDEAANSSTPFLQTAGVGIATAPTGPGLVRTLSTPLQQPPNRRPRSNAIAPPT